jgi:hypothetical protein
MSTADLVSADPSHPLLPFGDGPPRMSRGGRRGGSLRVMHPVIRTRLALGKLAIVVGGLAVALSACTGGGSQPSAGASSGTSTSVATAPATASPSEGLCADAAALRATVDQLTNVTVAPGLADEIRTDLNAVKSNLTTLVNDARGQWQAQTSALRSALDQLQTAVEKMVSSPGSGGASEVVTARDQVRKASQDLLAAMSPDCVATSPSPTG